MKNDYSFAGEHVEIFYQSKKILIDNDDFEHVSRYSWCISKTGYAVANINGKVTKMHRYILGISDNKIVDHKNGNPLDNRRCNLRICTVSENAKNRAPDNRSIYPGVRVHKNKTCTTYSVRITCNRVEYFVGTFPTLTQAVNARNRAENFFHKEFRTQI